MNKAIETLTAGETFSTGRFETRLIAERVTTWENLTRVDYRLASDASVRGTFTIVRLSTVKVY